MVRWTKSRLWRPPAKVLWYLCWFLVEVIHLIIHPLICLGVSSYLRTKSSLTDSHPPVPYCHGYVDSRWNHSHISLITSTYLPWEYALRANAFGIVPTLACKYNVSGPTKDYQPILIQLTIYLSLMVLVEGRHLKLAESQDPPTYLPNVTHPPVSDGSGQRIAPLLFSSPHPVQQTASSLQCIQTLNDI